MPFFVGQVTDLLSPICVFPPESKTVPPSRILGSALTVVVQAGIDFYLEEDVLRWTSEGWSWVVDISKS